MPLYTYKCTNEKCDNEYDQDVKLADYDKSATSTCPKCTAESKRIISPLKSKHSTWQYWR